MATARGDAAPAHAVVPPPVDVATIRRKTGLSQAKFARRYGFSPAAVRDWVQRRRTPDLVARTLLIVIDREPQAVDRERDRTRRRSLNSVKGEARRRAA